MEEEERKEKAGPSEKEAEWMKHPSESRPGGSQSQTWQGRNGRQLRTYCVRALCSHSSLRG